MTLYPKWFESTEAILTDELSPDVADALWDTNGLSELWIPQNGSIVKSLTSDQAREILWDLAA